MVKIKEKGKIMALVNATEMLKKAKAEGYAVAQFNINNLEWTKNILEVCEEAKSPVILGVSGGAAKYMGGFEVVANMVKTMHDAMNITVPVALHLDHGSEEQCEAAIAAGFTSIMFDGSHYDIDTNVEKTIDWVKTAHAKGISIEAEIGSIGGEEDGVVGTGEVADPEHAKLIATTGIDFLAAGIGNIHGQYPENWQGLAFDALNAINNATGDLPLVLHGGSGIPEEQIVKAISMGVAKINVNTELQLTFAASLEEYVKANKLNEGKGFDPRKIMAAGMVGMRKELNAKIDVFGSRNKA